MSMRYYLPLSILILTLAILTLSCSSHGAADPVMPSAQPELSSVVNSADQAQGKMLWGMWDVTIDTTTGETSVNLMRSAEFMANVTIFLQPPAGSFANLKFVNMDLTDYFTEGIIEMDVGLTHPFPGLDFYTGFDVMGVFRHHGSYTSQFDTTATWSMEDVDAVLMNADGYTRWFNAAEFTSPTILGYVPGGLGTPGFEPDSVLAPFKYFADGLEEQDLLLDYYANPDNLEDRGAFRPGSTNFRHYSLRFPMEDDMPVLNFQYSVIASWEPPEIEPYEPEEFPLSANMSEALVLHADTEESSVYNIDETTYGGTLSMRLEILDHQASVNPSGVTGEICAIVIESPDSLIPGGYMEFDQAALFLLEQPGTTGQSSVYELDIPNCEPDQAGDVIVKVDILSEDPDGYYMGFDVPYPEDALLTSYYITSLEVGDTSPDLPPVGGDIDFYWDCSGDPCSGQLTTFTITEAYDPDGQPVTIIWDFNGDMDYLDDMDGDDTNLAGEYVFPSDGIYNVWCKIDDGTQSTEIGPFEVNVMDCTINPVLVKNLQDPTYHYSRKIAIDENAEYAYIGMDQSNAVAIIDINPIADAHQVNGIPVGAYIMAIETAGGYVYAPGYNVINVVDVDPPETAFISATIPVSSGSMEDMEVVGDRLYVAGSSAGIMIFDITDPGNPTLLGNGPTVTGFGASVEATEDGMYGFLTDGYHNAGHGSWLRVFDISNPASPSLVQSVEVQDYDVLPHNMDYQDGYVYIIYHPWLSDPAMTVVDVSDPPNAFKVTDFDYGGNSWDVEVSGNYAYISHGNISSSSPDYLTIIDITDPTNPSLVQDFLVPGGIAGTQVVCETVYCSAWFDTLNIVNLW